MSKIKIMAFDCLMAPPTLAEYFKHLIQAYCYVIISTLLTPIMQ